MCCLMMNNVYLQKCATGTLSTLVRRPSRRQANLLSWHRHMGGARCRQRLRRVQGQTPGIWGQPNNLSLFGETYLPGYS